MHWQKMENALKLTSKKLQENVLITRLLKTVMFEWRENYNT
jgi:hypothetical protein